MLYSISIHAPHTRGDVAVPAQPGAGVTFQSTPPIRGATMIVPSLTLRAWISIHAPHTRGDYHRRGYFVSDDISIHAPHTRGDRYSYVNCSGVYISIHAPHTRGDVTIWFSYILISHFNPRPPYEGRLAAPARLVVSYFISIHAPHTRGDINKLLSLYSIKYFNPRPPYEGRPKYYWLYCLLYHFNPRPPYEGRQWYL